MPSRDWGITVLFSTFTIFYKSTYKHVFPLFVGIAVWFVACCTLVECYYIWLYRRIKPVANYNERRVVSDVKYSLVGVTIFRMNLMEMGSTYIQYYMFFLLLQVPVVELE